MIVEDKLPVAIAFSNPVDGSFYFRSSLESLSMAFDAMCEKNTTKLVKDDNKLVIKVYNRSSHADSWMRSVLDKICDNSVWSIGDVGRTNDDDSSINSIVSRYIGWADSPSRKSKNIRKQKR